MYALFLLGGDTERVHTEDIALKCYELFPGSFSWTKYPQYPDKDIVRVALTDARKDRYGALVKGRSGQSKGQAAKTRRAPVPDGWILTSGGVSWVRENTQRLESISSSGQAKEHRQKVLRHLARIKRHSLYVSFLEDPPRFAPEIGEIAELLRCRVDAEHEVWMNRFDAVRRYADSAEQEEVSKFLDLCERAYIEQK